MTNLLSLRLPFFLNLEIAVISKFAVDLSHDLLNGTLDLAFLTGIPDTPRITSVSVSKQPFFIVMLEQDELSWSIEITANQLANRSCVLFDRYVHPYLYDSLMQQVWPATAPGTSIHHVTTAEEAYPLVADQDQRPSQVTYHSPPAGLLVALFCLLPAFNAVFRPSPNTAWRVPLESIPMPP